MGQQRALRRWRQQLAASLTVTVLVLTGCGRSAPEGEVAGADPGSSVAADQTVSTDAQPTSDTGTGATVVGNDPAPAAQTTTTPVIVPGAGSAVQGPNEAGVRVVSDGPIVAPPPSPQPDANQSTDPNSAQTYLIESGDTLSGIAGKFGVPVDAIAQANGITDVDDIQPGQELIIPAPSPDQSTSATEQ